jgi:hypothetical protein
MRLSAAECDWVEAHAVLTRLARERAAADAEEGWLLRAWRAAVHVHLGHGSFAEYIERVLGYKPRVAMAECDPQHLGQLLPRAANEKRASEKRANEKRANDDLGFREREVKAVLAELLADAALREATAEGLLREAL